MSVRTTAGVLENATRLYNASVTGMQALLDGQDTQGKLTKLSAAWKLLEEGHPTSKRDEFSTSVVAAYDTDWLAIQETRAAAATAVSTMEEAYKFVQELRGAHTEATVALLVRTGKYTREQLTADLDADATLIREYPFAARTTELQGLMKRVDAQLAVLSPLLNTLLFLKKGDEGRTTMWDGRLDYSKTRYIAEEAERSQARKKAKEEGPPAVANTPVSASPPPAAATGTDGAPPPVPAKPSYATVATKKKET